MIITRTPFRISFFGGGTDYPDWFRQHGGAVLSTTINKYCYITCRHLPPFFEHKHRVVYSQIEAVNEIKDIDHPAVRAVFDYFKVNQGLEIHYDGDLPARSGIGSSSSFTVGLLNALFTFQGRIKSKSELANLALHIEQNVLKETVGSQDQIAAAYGGFNRIDFHKDESFSVSPVILPRTRANELNSRLMLFFTGFSRLANTVAMSKVANFAAREKQLFRMREMVDQAENILQDPTTDIDDFGRLLYESWEQKRQLSDKVSNEKIDEIMQKGMRAGAIGGKILGAGGGGFILFYVPQNMRGNLKEALHDLIEVDFKFEYKGSQVLLYDPDTAIYEVDRGMGVDNKISLRPENLS